MNTILMVLLGSAVATASAIQGRFVNSTTTATPDVVYTTEVVTALTTYCPAPTTITHGTKTYTVTKATTLTITDCPCTISKPVKPTGTPTPGDECAKKCYDAYNKCRGAPGANFAVCGSDFASCLGYNPFAGGNGTLVTPTACSKVPASVTPTQAVVYTTEVVTALTTYCPAPTTITHGTKTYTVTKPTTLTITDCPCTISKPVKPTGTPSKDCAEMCYDAYNKCRGAPGANFAVCGSQFAGCLGYNPFTGGNGTLVKPTACSSGSTGSATKPVVLPTQSKPAGGKTCAEMCYDAYNMCRGKSGANMAVCGSDFAGCLGYNPFTGNGGSLVKPTACSSGATGTATGPVPTGPVATGTKPTSPPVVTAGAGAVAPAKVLLALGAIALL